MDINFDHTFLFLQRVYDDKEMNQREWAVKEAEEISKKYKIYFNIKQSYDANIKINKKEAILRRCGFGTGADRHIQESQKV